jgi:uncharacterized protein (DUF2147 family)
VRIWLPLLLTALVAMVSPARAQGPTGEWLVESGAAHIRIVDCGGTLWGVVSWEKIPGRDSHNPDPALRDRPTLGIPILLHMKPGDDPGQWEGEVYNAKNGRSYDASIETHDANTLHVEGCALGVLCGGEDWTRLAETQPSKAKPGNAASTTGAPGAPASTADICASITGRPH